MAKKDPLKPMDKTSMPHTRPTPMPMPEKMPNQK